MIACCKQQTNCRSYFMELIWFASNAVVNTPGTVLRPQPIFQVFRFRTSISKRQAQLPHVAPVIYLLQKQYKISENIQVALRDLPRNAARFHRSNFSLESQVSLIPDTREACVLQMASTDAFARRERRPWFYLFIREQGAGFRPIFT
jgi:hypothetical protein